MGTIGLWHRLACGPLRIPCFWAFRYFGGTPATIGERLSLGYVHQPLGSAFDEMHPMAARNVSAVEIPSDLGSTVHDLDNQDTL
jgi:hypothetical protein